MTDNPAQRRHDERYPNLDPEMVRKWTEAHRNASHGASKPTVSWDTYAQLLDAYTQLLGVYADLLGGEHHRCRGRRIPNS